MTDDELQMWREMADNASVPFRRKGAHRLLAEIDRLKSALREIAEHKHCRRDALGDWTMRQESESAGHITGHRCCAEIARKALEAEK